MDFDVASAFRGVTIPIRELINEIEARGWEANVQLQGGEYVASGKNGHGESLEGTGPTDATAAGNLLNKIMRRETIRQPFAKLALWDTTFSGQMAEIAAAYAKAPVYDPKAAPAWKALADDSMRRAEVIKQQIEVEVVPDPEPYDTPQEMCQDVHQNKHFLVSSANCQHPLWSVEQNIAFRIVHDVMGHCVSGGDFGWEGENRACAAHFPLLDPLAQKALFTECIGQTAAAAYFRSFMAQKVAFLDEFLDDAQAQENDPNHTGVHPSQSLTPTAMPQVQPSQQQGLPWATQVPHEDFSGGIPVFGSVASPRDPNYQWSSGIDAMPNAAYLWGGDPLEAQNVKDTALKIDTGWEKWNNPKTGQPDLESMKLAIINAFRAVLLSPRKDLRWNAVHYQDIAHIPAHVDDPKRYWDALEERRIAWNTARGFHPDSHKPYFKELAEFRRFMAAQHPDLDPVAAQEQADMEFMHMWNEEEDRLLADEKNHRLDAGEVERKVANEMKKRLKAITRPAKDDTDWGHEQMHMMAAGTQYDLEGNEAGKYGAFMGTHLKQIAALSQHADELLEAAVEDVKEYGGTGHHFRAKTLALGIPGVGPKVCSFAWLLLQPATSQLATIDTHMMDVLGHDYDKKMSDRDYFKFERELAAGRDAAGYGHVPLGQFQWGMWDYKRTGPGTHQDHSSLKAVNPTPHDQIDWAAKSAPMAGDERWQAPQWWVDTEPARQLVADDWDRNIAPQFSRNVVPRFAKKSRNTRRYFGTKDARILPRIKISSHGASRRTSSSIKTAGTSRIPWILWGEQVWIGAPGETFMNLARRQLGYSMEDVWQRLPEEQFSAGVYDPEASRIFPQDQINSLQQETVLREVTRGAQVINDVPRTG